jgi:tRNA pseudouridine13 synthase
MITRNFPIPLSNRYQDFHVKEIGTDGNIVSLSELILRNDVSEELKATTSLAEAAYSTIGPSFELTDSQRSSLVDMMDESDFTALLEFLLSEPTNTTPYCVLRGTKLNSDKEVRKSFHSYIREQFGGFLSTDTFEEGDVRSLRVWIKKFHSAEQDKYKTSFHAAKRQKLTTHVPPPGASVGVMMKDPWPKDRPNYLHFHLYKENRDTAEAIQCLARCLRIPPKSFQFAGTKDRRGITVQSVSVYRISIDAMKRAILHSAWDKAIRVSDFAYKDFAHKIGASGGNHFIIALKNIPSSVPENHIESLFSSLRDNGFYNYYGPQRFGTRSVRTHHIGILLLAQDWKGVVDALLSPAADKVTSLPEEATEDTSSRNQWRSEYMNGNIEKAHELCPPYMYIEKSLLRSLHLSGQSGNYLNAIQALPSSTVQLYLHAVQSLMFNAALSERVEKFGRVVVEGDLIMSGSGDVRIVESDEDLSRISFASVVIPLVGSSVLIPPNMRDFYTNHYNRLTNACIDILTNPPAGTQKFLKLSGAYRKIVSLPKNLTWSVHQNIGEKDVVIESDVDRLKKHSGVPIIEELESEPVIAEDSSPVPKSQAVVFECSLDSGVYLTMAAREVTQLLE